jgi:hypothetical protein
VIAGQWSPDGADTVADDDRRIVKDAFVDETGLEERAEDAPASFHKDREEIETAEGFHQREEIDAAGRLGQVQERDPTTGEMPTHVVRKGGWAGNDGAIGECVVEDAPIRRDRFLRTQNDANGAPLLAP